MRVMFWAGLIVMLACKNEIVSLILLVLLAVWGVIKLLSEMGKGGY